MGFFLWTYDPKFYDKSYGNRDRYFGKAAAIFAIAVAFFPTTRENWSQSSHPPSILKAFMVIFISYLLSFFSGL